MKRITFITIFTLLLVLTAACFAEPGDVVFKINGLTVSIPAEIAGQLTIETQESSERDILFSISETASIEAAKAEGYTWDGAGWLFSIGTVSEEQYHEMLCEDMTGVYVFAKDAEGNYYLCYHPTDVRLIREGNAYDEENLNAWSKLNEWANSMPSKIIEENELTAETHGNTMLDIYLARLLYHDNENYTVSTTQYGPMEPNGVKASDYIDPLVNGAKYTMLYDEEAPDGEYAVINFPDEGVRLDFFFKEGKENYIRQVWSDGSFEQLYKGEFDDANVKASEIINTMYLDMVLANSLGYTPDDMVGVWAEKIAGRGSIEIRKGDAEGSYTVNIHWGSSAFETSFWTMTAFAADSGSELQYEDCKLVDIVFSSDDQSTETTKYENGKGSFSLLSTYELVWNDETGHAADDVVFIKAGD